ncbi:MAG: class I SAM-dependent methyltransferase [Methylococcales bacterium]
MKALLKKIVGIHVNEESRDQWLANTLTALPAGLRILDAGAGELRNKPLCAHLNYVSQDICQYQGTGDTQGLQTGKWDTSRVDLVSDIVNIPEPDAAFDVILCSEVFEHLPDALKALDEFARLLKPGGKLIVTAPFASLVHFAPYHFATGFSRYWYERHLPERHFELQELTPNGDWFAYAKQEMLRLPSMAYRYDDWHWPLAYLVTGVSVLYFALRGNSRPADDVACFGWHCIAVRQAGTAAGPA